MARAVLVTGASSGIGRATAHVLAGSGYRVFAGMRSVPDDPPQEGICPVVLDVTDPASIAEACRTLAARLEGQGLFALVNNAGIGDTRPLEFTPMDAFRKVFEVDVFGVLAVTQAFLPLIHRGRGRIITIGSVGGMITIPFGGALCASKHAVEAVSDALRLELWEAGIPVTLIQPASINSGAAEKLASQTGAVIAGLPPEGRRRYADALRHFMKVTLRKEAQGSPPEAVAEVVLRVLRAGRPPARILAGKDGRRIRFLARWMPVPWRDAVLRKILLGGP
ncbi:MAG TPA: SDR family oxidoreductase, partial [Terrimicrobiaceae bacterium]|nr:SDR family oxidoreductase [Terrimicrobiaceae bacterium]